MSRGQGPYSLLGSLNRNLIHGLLLAGGTALLVGAAAHLATHSRLREADTEACRASATQLAVALGTDLLEHSDTPAGRITSATLRKLLRDDTSIQSLYTLARRGGRDVVVQSLSRDGKTYPTGKVLSLTKHGHRAVRTGAATVEQNGRLVVRAPIRTAAGDVRGLLVVENEPASTLFGFADIWSLLLLPLLAAGAMAFWLTVYVVRPVSRMRKNFADIDPQMAEPNTIADAAETFDILIERISQDRSLLEAQLRQRTRQLRESSKTRDEVLANTVHELRTPLSTIMVTLDILRDMEGLTEDERSEFLTQATAASQHMKFLVNDILDSAAIDSGKITIDAANCSLSNIFRAAERVMQPSALAQSIELLLDPGDTEIGVFADHSRVLQIVFNLLSNAIKYSPEGRKVTLRASANALAAVVEVEDEGDGVPTSSRARLFTKFTRLPHNHQHAVEGSGIGLYLSKQLVELMDGNIGYHQRDEEGAQGSIFWFTLPLAKGPVEAAALTESTQHDDDA